MLAKEQPKAIKTEGPGWLGSTEDQGPALPSPACLQNGTNPRRPDPWTGERSGTASRLTDVHDQPQHCASRRLCRSRQRTPGQRASPPGPVQRHLRPRVDPSAALGVRPCSVEDRWPVEDPPTKVSSKVFVWFPTSEMMMLFAAEIGAVAGLMMGP